MGPLGFTEIALILVIALLLFGPDKLPELGRMIGKGLREFRRASTDLRATIEDEIREIERTGSVEDARTIHRPPSDPSTPGSA
jgi:TatA/E family protein of Tat protein translocase